MVFNEMLVTDAISKLKTNKATGVDNIPSEFFTYGGKNYNKGASCSTKQDKTTGGHTF